MADPQVDIIYSSNFDTFVTGLSIDLVFILFLSLCLFGLTKLLRVMPEDTVDTFEHNRILHTLFTPKITVNMLRSLVRDALVVKFESFVLRAIQLYKFVDTNEQPFKYQIPAFLKITFLVKWLIFIPPGVVAMHCVDLWQQRKFRMENQRQRHEAWKKLIELWRTGKDGFNDEELEVFKRHGIDPQRYIDDEKDENR